MIWTQDKVDKLLEMYNSYRSAAEIAKTLDVQTFEVDIKLDELKLPASKK